MPHIISGWSVANGVSVSVSESKLVYSNVVFATTKPKTDLPLTQEQLTTVSDCHTQVIC